VLSVISSSPGDLEPVFETLLANAVRICGAKFGMLFLPEGDDGHRIVALHGAPPAFAEVRRREPVIRQNPATTLGRVAATKQVVQVEDIRADPAYTSDPTRSALLDLSGARTMLNVPMLKDDELVGQIAIYRQEVRPFSEKQITLLQNFAAQAVIAIENTRLLNELRQSLQQQTATADVLKVISRSTFDLSSVLNTLVESAAALCRADKAQILLPGKNVHSFYAAASHGFTPEYNEYLSTLTFEPSREGVVGRVLLERKPVQIADVLADPEYRLRETQRLGGFRTHLGLPLLREGNPIGILVVSRTTVMPFEEKHIELLTTFADQAVIAIENVRLFDELRESLEQQTATSEVLSVISSSPGELEPVFQAILQNATRICEAKFGTLYLREDDVFRFVAEVGTPPELVEAQKRRGSFQPQPGGYLQRIMQTKQVSFSADAAAETVIGVAARLGGARSLVAVPMLKENALIGALVIYRQEVRPFTNKQIDLVKNFAAQAVIAIENTRLLSELRESLQQQTATADVLKVISSSPGDLEPVFQAVLENATRICEAKFGTLFLRDGDLFRVVAAHGAPAAYREMLFHAAIRPGPDTGLGMLLKTKRFVQIDDITKGKAYLERDPLRVATVELGGGRTLAEVPLLKDGELIGSINIYHQEVKPFTEKQVELLTNFAAQAVIAIENTRLLNELRQSLEQQTATSEVLGVISSSPGTLEPVFKAMLENATRLCEANFGILHLHEGGGTFSITAAHNAPPAFAELQRREPLFQPSPQSAIGRAIATKGMVHIADYAEEPVYKRRDPIAVRLIELAGARSLLTIPMLKEDELIGTISIFRQEVRPFTEKQIALVTNFAAQAVIAIENTRLLNELRESLEQQTATSEVLGVISSSPGDLEPVFQAMMANATRICEAKFGVLQLHENGRFRNAAMFNPPPALAEYRHREPVISAGPQSAIGRVAATKQLVHIVDYAADAAYIQRDPAAVNMVERAGARTILLVPMLKDGEHVGNLNIYRQEVRPFTDKQIALVQNFAAQAVIAIENTRLLSELRQRTADLSESLEQQTATSKVLEVISRSAFDLHAVFETVAESSVRLCGADRAFIFRFDGELLRMAVAYNSPPEFTAWVEQHRRVAPAWGSPYPNASSRCTAVKSGARSRGETAARSYPDGYPTSGHGRLRGDAPDAAVEFFDGPWRWKAVGHNVPHTGVRHLCLASHSVNEAIPAHAICRIVDHRPHGCGTGSTRP
jgi:GAF domain-containing protein